MDLKTGATGGGGGLGVVGAATPPRPSATVRTSQAGADDKPKSKKDGTGFVFDIIVVRVDVPNETFAKPDLLTVDVKFNNVDLKITSSRINVVEFRSGRSYEFIDTPLNLKEQLKKQPLALAVKYEDRVIGKYH